MLFKIDQSKKVNLIKKRLISTKRERERERVFCRLTRIKQVFILLSATKKNKYMLNLKINFNVNLFAAS